jgi:hypothetical protein
MNELDAALNPASDMLCFNFKDTTPQVLAIILSRQDVQELIKGLNRPLYVSDGEAEVLKAALALIPGVPLYQDKNCWLRHKDNR